MDIILKLNEKGQLNALSVTSLRDKIAQQEKKSSFITYGNSLVKDLKDANRIGTARSYSDLLSVLKSYKGENLSFTDITYSFLTKFEAHHLGKSNGINGFAVYMRTPSGQYIIRLPRPVSLILKTILSKTTRLKQLRLRKGP